MFLVLSIVNWLPVTLETGIGILLYMRKMPQREQDQGWGVFFLRSLTLGATI